MTPALVLSALAMGFVGSTHCVAMCGGIAGALGGRPSRAVAYNAGRVLSYAACGAVAGALGALTQALPFVRDAQLGLRVLAAALLLGTGLWLVGVFGAFTAVERVGAPLWGSVSGVAGRLMASRRPGSAFGVGLLWGFMPCGLAYAALGLAAASGSAAEGALSMAAFGTGTAPMLLAIAAFAGGARRVSRAAWPKRIAGVVLCASAMLQIQAARATVLRGAGAPAACCHAQH